MYFIFQKFMIPYIKYLESIIFASLINKHDILRQMADSNYNAHCITCTMSVITAWTYAFFTQLLHLDLGHNRLEISYLLEVKNS